MLAWLALAQEKVEGGGIGIIVVLPLFSALLALTVRFLVLAIRSMSIDEINNTQKNDSRGQGIVANPQR
jgi:hypothetical protein